MKTAAFFDLDKTLITINSGRAWMQSEFRKGQLSTWNFIEALVYLVAYRFGIIDMDHAMSRAMKTIEGQQEEELRRRTHLWFENEVQGYAAKGAWNALDEHRHLGHALVLLTSSSLYESEIATRFFDLDDFLCTRYRVEDGRFTGEVVKPMCYGSGKVIHAKAWAQKHGVELSRSYFYTDSITDLPMLTQVGNPRIVNPDPRLRRLAKKKSWPILDWS